MSSVGRCRELRTRLPRRLRAGSALAKECRRDERRLAEHARTLHNFGIFRLKQGLGEHGDPKKRDEAQGMLESALTIRKRLANEAFPDARRGLARTHDAISDLPATKDDPIGPEKHRAEAIALLRALVEENPHELNYRAELAELLDRRGLDLLNRKRYADSAADFRAAVQELEVVCDRTKGSICSRFDYSASLQYLTYALGEQIRRNESRGHPSRNEPGCDAIIDEYVDASQKKSAVLCTITREFPSIEVARLLQVDVCEDLPGAASLLIERAEQRANEYGAAKNGLQPPVGLGASLIVPGSVFFDLAARASHDAACRDVDKVKTLLEHMVNAVPDKSKSIRNRANARHRFSIISGRLREPELALRYLEDGVNDHKAYLDLNAGQSPPVSELWNASSVFASKYQKGGMLDKERELWASVLTRVRNSKDIAVAVLCYRRLSSVLHRQPDQSAWKGWPTRYCETPPRMATL